MGLKILHTSDIHLGAKLVYLGENAEMQRQQIADTFVSVMDYGVKEKVDMVVITGDIFDSKYPSRVDTMLVIDQIMKLTAEGIYIAIIPGNHDRYEEGSIYLKQQFANFKSDKFKLFTRPEAVQWFIAALDVTVHGAAVTRQKDKNSQLPSYTTNHDSKYNVGLIHGGVSLQAEADNYPISKDDMDSLKYNYLALGDWHSTLDVSTKHTTAWYAGSPEILAISQKKSGSALLVRIDDNGKTNVDIVNTAKRQVNEIKIDMGQYKDLYELQKEILKYKGKNTLLKVNVSGFKDVSFGGDLDKLVEDISKEFFYIDISDKSELKLTEESLNKFPEEFVTGKYIRLLQGTKTGDMDKDKIIDEAIQLGVKLLENKNADS